MANAKRERQRANRQLKIEETKAEEVVETRKSRASTWGILAAILIAGILLFAFCGRGGDSEDSGDTFLSGETAENDGSAPALRAEDIEDRVDASLKPVGNIPDDFVPWSGTRQLSESTPGLRNAIYETAPPMTIDTSKSYEALITTNRGEMRLALFDDESPITVNNFVSLARDGYYDGVGFHRVLADFMAQGGDPTGLGSGGPGYQFEDEFDNGLALDARGLLAMANAGPGTNGSQFFITFVPTEYLTGRHTVFGELIDGDDVLASLRLRDPATDPALGDIMLSVEIIES